MLPPNLKASDALIACCKFVLTSCQCVIIDMQFWRHFAQDSSSSRPDGEALWNNWIDFFQRRCAELCGKGGYLPGSQWQGVERCSGTLCKGCNAWNCRQQTDPATITVGLGAAGGDESSEHCPHRLVLWLKLRVMKLWMYCLQILNILSIYDVIHSGLLQFWKSCWKRWQTMFLHQWFSSWHWT